MWSDVVVLFEPFVDDGLRLLEGREPLGIEDLASERPLNRSLYPFSQGLPG